MSFLYVALGGAVGALGRYAISLIPTKTEFPVLTLITNLVGAVLIGFIVGLLDGRDETSKNRSLRWFYNLFGFFTGSAGFIGKESVLLGGLLFSIECHWMYYRCILRQESSFICNEMNSGLPEIFRG